MNRQSSSTFQPQNVHRQTNLQGVTLANFRPRAIAFAIDLLIVAVALVLIDVWKNFPDMANQKNIRISFSSGGILSFVLFIAYFALTTYFGNGSTPGKKVMGITVISIVHDHLSFWHCIERALGYVASSLEAGFGFIQFFIHPNRQTVHDRIAETIVITKKQHAKET